MRRAWILWGLAMIVTVLSGILSLKGRPLVLLVLTPDQYGQRLYRQERFEEASLWFQSSERKGAALYRAGNFEEAFLQLSGNPSAEAGYNSGNALAMQGKYTEAILVYERVLTLRPQWMEAEENCEIAIQSAARLEKKGGNMTGGEMGADDFTFSKKKGTEEEGFEATDPSSDGAANQAIWLRQVQTRPADFLRAKFSYQAAMAKQPVEEQ